MKRLVVLFSLVALLSACVKPDKPKEIRFSILGDSYSAYEGAVDPDSNDVFPYDTIGLTGAEQMWWYKVANEKGWILEKNNSFSGSLVCNYDYVHYYGQYSFLHRMDNLGHPDVIFVFGATNDACAHNGNHNPIVPLGDYVYADWTEEQLCTFRPALSYLFDYLKQNQPQAKLYFLLDMDLGSGSVTLERRDAFVESIHHIANHYNVECVDLYEIHKSYWHPNVKGQEDIARQVVEAIAADFNV